MSKPSPFLDFMEKALYPALGQKVRATMTDEELGRLVMSTMDFELLESFNRRTLGDKYEEHKETMKNLAKDAI